ncbi:MAG: mannose-1-phosphate guanylyltransferase [Candidatus Andersenbacteria bacterium]|nr:mannose-1-phosphate guanylyltransferase [Candidatus Andersenbacteria bacterium]
MNIVLMAGGAGTRLWPLSRTSTPKQFLKLDGKKTLLETAYDRARMITLPGRIFIATSQAYGATIQQLLPDVQADQIFYEPERRDTAPAFAAVARQLVMRGEGQEPTVFMWSDHVFTSEKEYVEDVKKIPQILAAHPQSIVIAGHIPTFPETGFGYIELGDKVVGFKDVYQVNTFKEKPDLATAETYVSSGNYVWNMGCVSAIPDYLVEQLTKFEPEMMASIGQFANALKTNESEVANAAYGQAKKISIDYALLERTSPIYVVTGDYGWNDVGNWATVHDVFGSDGDHDPHRRHIHVDSKNNYIYNDTDRAVSMIGMANTIVVVTDDAILITDKSKAHQVKEVVARLEKTDKKQYL